MMRVDGDSMKDAGILDGDLLVADRSAKPLNGSVVVVGAKAGTRSRSCAVVRIACGWTLRTRSTSRSACRIGEELHVFGVVKHAIHNLR